MTTYSTLKVESRGPRLNIIINRPDALNALNCSVLEELEEALLEDFDANAHRAIVIEGAGEKAFVAGADISEMKEMTSEEAHQFAQLGQSIGNIIATLPSVVIAKVRGFALGGGCELAMACDLVVASKSAKFGQPEVNLGLIAGFGGTQRLVKRVGPHVALDMLLTGRGRVLSGDDAFHLGLVSRVVDDDKLDAEIDKMVDSLGKTGPSAVADTKRLVRDAQHMSLDAGLSAEAAAFALCFSRDESREGIAAFLEKRTPKFDAE
jgi:enoyl-CoA hydratase